MPFLQTLFLFQTIETNLKRKLQFRFIEDSILLYPTMIIISVNLTLKKLFTVSFTFSLQ